MDKLSDERSFACVDYTITPSIKWIYNVVLAKSNFFSRRIKRYIEKYGCGIFWVEEFIWRVDPQLWWRDECAKRTREIQIPTEAEYDDDDNDEKNNERTKQINNAANIFSHEMITNDQNEMLRKWIYRNGNGHISREINTGLKSKAATKKNIQLTNPVFTLPIPSTNDYEASIHEFLVMCACKIWLPFKQFIYHFVNEALLI